MRHLATMVILGAALTGCFWQEPYPGWAVVEMAYPDIPRKVRAAFQNDFGDVRVTRVEESTFESRMSGHPKKYRLFFERPEVGMQHVIYDREGRRDDRFDFWFDDTGRVR